jgi:hypothetical protein
LVMTVVRSIRFAVFTIRRFVIGLLDEVCVLMFKTLPSNVNELKFAL